MALVTSSTEPAVSWQRDVPEPIRSLDTLIDPDYTDLFTASLSGAPARSAEAWTKAALAGGPALLRTLVPVVHRFVLGFRLGPPRAPGYLMGWRIAASEETWLRLETSSWFLTAHLVIHVDHDQLSMGTFLRYDRRIAAVIWPPVSLLHRQAGLSLMRHVQEGP